jgi:hypothetical protein
MKKILTTLAVSAFTAGAFAQGFINWSGSGTSLIGQTNGTTYSSFVPAGGLALTGTVGGTMANNAANTTALGYQGYYYELLTSTTAVADPSTVLGLGTWSDTGLGATNTFNVNTPGRIIQAGGGALVSAGNWPVGNTQAIILVGWSANLGSSWSTVLGELQNWGTQGAAFVNNTANAAYFGVSSFGSGVQSVASTGTGNQVIGVSPGEIFNNSSSPMQLNELGVVPEPGTMALAALGGASMLLFRRKK